MQAKLVAVFGSLLVITAAFAATEEYCTSSECKTQRRHSMLMEEVKEYRKELSKYKQTLQESSCSICNVEGTIPCYNNGTCIVTDPYQYICDCPDNTAGDHCEDLLSCDESNPCGHGAICTVFNHKKICTCPPGTSGNPLVSCDIRSKSACLSGDPHFTTFDGTTFDYQGTCPYYVMTSCNASDEFSIIGTNVLTSPNSPVSVILEMSLTTQGHVFKVDSASNYFIDGIRAYYPNYWPSQDDPRVVATKPSTQVIIQDNVHSATITFYPQSSLCIDVPLTPFFFGADKMCGLMGNIDDVCTDDVKAKNGDGLTTSTCNLGTNLNVLHFQDTWIVDNTVDNCQAGEVVSNMTSCDTPTSQNQCDLIRQSITGQGPFGQCVSLGADIVTQYFHDCTFDVCNGVPQCDALDTFATLCINQRPFADIDHWRDSVNCPYTCPPHSHYSMKTPRCQNTCSDHNYSNSSSCQDSYEEGCICDPNYYFDSNGNTNGFPFACRLIDDCGCVDTNGNYDLPNTHWLNANCSVETECNDGIISSQPTACSIEGQCNNVNGFPTCQCINGYSGDGFNCTDIDECQNPTVCNVNIGQGVCTNLPGTYTCTCLAPYSGDQCQDYTPSRHCADLQLFHGVIQSGAYNVSIGADYNSGLTNSELNGTLVYCDMDDNGGGWTLMSHGNSTSGKTFEEYVAGFGDANSKNTWLGLDNINELTQTTPTSLRIVIERCATPIYADETTECTYNYFAVSDSTNQYSVFLNSSCSGGNETNRHDGWVTWNMNQQGPKFVTFDNGDIHNCSSHFHNTGWWFNYITIGAPCGSANLNGLRYACGGDETPYMGQYLEWANYPVEDAYMYLRPREYPNYDNHYASSPTSETFITTSDF